MMYSSFADTEKGGGMLLISLFLLLVPFFTSSTIAASIFLLSHFLGNLEALVVCEVKLLEGFHIHTMVLLADSTNLVKLGICRFSKYERYLNNILAIQISTSLSSYEIITY